MALLILGISPATWLTIVKMVGLISDLNQSQNRLPSAAEGRFGANPFRHISNPSKEDMNMTAALNLLTGARTDLVAAPAAAPAATPRKVAKVWVNIGGTFKVSDGNGGTEEVFVSAFGVPVDILEPVKDYTGKNDRMRQISEAKAMILNAIQGAGDCMDPGSASPINGLELELELRRVGAVQNSAEGENPILEQISSRLKIG